MSSKQARAHCAAYRKISLRLYAIVKDRLKYANIWFSHNNLCYQICVDVHLKPPRGGLSCDPFLKPLTTISVAPENDFIDCAARLVIDALITASIVPGVPRKENVLLSTLPQMLKEIDSLKGDD